MYLQTFQYKEGYVLYSAGITSSTKQRFYAHTSSYRKGEYNVLDVNSAQKGEREEIWHGWNYAKTHQDEFRAQNETISKAVENQLNAFRIFISEIYDKRKKERIEAAIMQNIYISKEHWSELADRGMKLNGRYNSEMPIKIKNNCPNKIYGIPETLEI